MGVFLQRAGLLGSAAAIPDYAVGGDDPKTVADFVEEYYRTGGSATTFASMFTFARASDATYVDSAGVIQTASSGVARVGHHKWNGAAWVDKGLLLETEARTNSVTQSEDFSAASWIKNEVTVSVNAVEAPDGTLTADKLVETTATNSHHARIDGLTAVAGEPITISVFAKSAGDSRWAVLRSNQAGSDDWIVVDLADGSITDSSTGQRNENVEVFANGWYRLSLTFDAAGSAAGIVVSLSNTATPGSGAPSYAGDGASGIYFWGATRERNVEVVSSYIATAGAAATRAAETLTIAGADMADSTTAMSFQIDGELDYADEGTVAQQTFFRWQADASNYVSMDLDTDSTATGEVNANQSAAGTVDTVVAGTEYTAGLGVAFNIASRNTSGAINVAKDGTAATEDTTPTALADLSAATFELGYDFMGTIAQFRQWDVDLGDSGIASATA